MAQYGYRKQNGRFVVYEDDYALGSTEYEVLARRCLDDITQYGANPYEERSALRWIHTWEEPFDDETHARILETIRNTFFSKPDWTWGLDLGEIWNDFIGDWGYRRQMILEWLSKASVLQLVAAFHLGDIYESLNLAFSLAMLMEQKEGQERAEAISSVIEILSMHPKYQDKEKNRVFFDLFELFYGIHLNENGPILTELIEKDKKHNREAFTLKMLPLYTVSEDWLRGRNYRPFAGEESESQWWGFVLGKGLENLLSNDAEAPVNPTINEDELVKHCKDRCWIKRFISKDESDKHYVVIVYVDEGWNVKEAQCIAESLAKPLADAEIVTAALCYEECENPPKYVMDDLYKLVRGRFLFTGISFVGKRLPKVMDCTRSYTVLSPYRPVTSSFRFHIDQDGFINGFEYATYKGNPETDKDTENLEDRAEEKVEALLHFFDLYDDRQWLTEIAFPDDNVTIRNREFEKMSAKEWIRFISENPLTKEDLGWLYCYGLEYRDLLTDSENLLELTKAFFERGMDPNQLVTDEYPNGDWSKNSYDNPMLVAVRFENEAAGVASLKFLLEHGGNPNTVVNFEAPGIYEENVFDWFEWDEDVNGDDEEMPERTIYGMILTWAYGGKRACGGLMPYQMLIDAPPTILKDYERYWCKYSEGGKKPLYIIEKATGRRVAKYL